MLPDIDGSNFPSAPAEHEVQPRKTHLARRYIDGANRLKRWSLSKPSLALIDQCIASGTRFVVIILIGRLAGLDSLGVYTMAVGAIIAAAVIQEALVSRPYMVFSNQMGEQRRRLYGGSVVVQLGFLVFFGALVCLAFSGIAGALAVPSAVALQGLAWSMAVAVPGVLLWEFARRYAFARMDMGAAIGIDACLAVLQISALLGLYWWQGYLDEYLALRAVGLTSLVVGGVALALQRRNFAIRWRRVRPDFGRNWRFGKWMCLGQLIGLVQFYAVPYLLAYTLGKSATGALMACHTIVLMSNPFLLGMANWLGPKAARVYSDGGASQVIRLTRQAVASLGGLMLLFWLVLVVVGQPLFQLLYGDQFSGQGALLSILGTSAVGFALTIAATSGLAAMHRTRLIMLGTVIGTVFTLAAFLPLVQAWGVGGAAAALGLGSVTTGAVHVLGFELAIGRGRHAP